MRDPLLSMNGEPSIQDDFSFRNSVAKAHVTIRMGMTFTILSMFILNIVLLFDKISKNYRWVTKNCLNDNKTGVKLNKMETFSELPAYIIRLTIERLYIIVDFPDGLNISTPFNL